MSGWVRAKYYKEPTTCRYWVSSIAKLPSHNLSDSLVERGVVTSFVSCMFIFNNKSWIYFLYDKKRPKDVYVAFTPK